MRSNKGKSVEMVINFCYSKAVAPRASNSLGVVLIRKWVNGDVTTVQNGNHSY